MMRHLHIDTVPPLGNWVSKTCVCFCRMAGRIFGIGEVVSMSCLVCVLCLVSFPAE